MMYIKEKFKKCGLPAPPVRFWRTFTAIAAVAVAGCLTAITTHAQVYPDDYGQTVNGYQEEFNGTEKSENWVPVGGGGDVYQQSSGTLKVSTAAGDPNHLLLQVPSGYDMDNQEVLARFRVTDFGSGDGPRGGIGVAVSTEADIESRGIDLHFRNHDQHGYSGYHLKFLNDNRMWMGDNDEDPAAIDYEWQVGEWYWMRVAHTNIDGSATAYGKIWAADGETAEPDD
ncbi:MAG: hypothetical protein K9N48_02340, partial [Verrucomicrobia bacterium]|nr:hypothetical protein [Verrucomicrobiota bacterium]MCF7708808.1 hypothetical protein [Verrucomicrobiota bacterium]